MKATQKFRNELVLVAPAIRALRKELERRGEDAYGIFSRSIQALEGMPLLMHPDTLKWEFPLVDDDGRFVDDDSYIIGCIVRDALKIW